MKLLRCSILALCGLLGPSVALAHGGLPITSRILIRDQTLDEDTTKALTRTPVWTAYLDSRRALERTRADIEKFAEVMKLLDEE